MALTCACCASTLIRYRYTKKGQRIHTCASCGFAFVSPLPTEERIKAHYTRIKIDDDLTLRIRNAIQEIRHSKNSPKRDWFTRIVAVAQRHTRKEKLNILEVGSSYGYFIDHCNNSGHDATGTEVIESYAEASHGLINGEVVFVEDGNYRERFRGRRFDLIYLEHVFEHLLHPSEMLKQLSELLAQDGILIITVPNHMSLLGRIMGRFYAWTSPPDHLHYYGRKSLTALARGNGLNTPESWTGDYYHRSIYQFYSMDFFIHGFKRILGKLFNVPVKTRHAYRYPRRLVEIATLLPYLIFRPLINFLNGRWDLGSELTMILQRR